MCPGVELSSGIHQVCIRMGMADPIAISSKTTANNLPMRRLLAKDSNRGACRPLIHANRRALSKTCSIRLGSENEVGGFCFVAADRDFLCLRPVTFMPRSQCVFSGREIGQLEFAGTIRNGVVRSLEHHEPAVHPRMNVALHGDKFWLVVFFADRRRSWWLGLIPFAIDLRQRVNIVRSLVAVRHFQFLIDLEREDMGRIVTALLIETNCRGWRA